MSEIRTITDRIIRQLYGDGGSTIRKEVLAGVRAGTIPARVQGLSGLF